VATAQDVKAIVEQIPSPDKNGTYVNLDEAKIGQIEKTVAQLQQGGRDAVAALIGMLVEPGAGDDIKPRWALHLLAVRAAAPGNDAARKEYALAVAAHLGGDRPKEVQKYLIEKLQIAGGPEVLEALGRALLDDELCDTAARALAAIGGEADRQLLAAWPRVKGRSRLSVIKKLAVLRCAAAAEIFRSALNDADADVRIAGAWGIARIGDAAGTEALLKCADAHEGWERINETDACMMLAEALAAAGNRQAAAKIYEHISRTRNEQWETPIRQAAERGLAAVRQQ